MKILCPNCKSRNINLSQTFTQELNAMIDYKFQRLEYYGFSNPSENECVFAKCYDCEHIWKLRKFKTLTGIEDEVVLNKP